MKKLFTILLLIAFARAKAQLPIQEYYTLLLTNTATASYDVDAQGFFDRETTAGYTLSTPEKDSVNSFITKLKASGIYAKITEMWLFIGGTAATHALGFKNAYNLTFTGSLTHNSMGTVGDSTTGYATTGIIPSAVFTINNTHLSVYSQIESTNTGMDIGCRNATGQTFEMNIRNTTLGFLGDFYSTGANTGRLSVASQPSSVGFFVLSRTSTSDFRAYWNSSQIGSTVAASGGSLPTVGMYLFGVNSNGTAGISNREISFASVGQGLTVSEATTFSILVNNLQKTFGRNKFN